MITPEEAGNIFGRLARADEKFLASAVQAAKTTDSDILPEDVEKLEDWGRLMWIIKEHIDSIG